MCRDEVLAVNMINKRIILITDSYPPEIRSGSHVMHELALELRDRGYAVTVVTCYPRHNIAERDRSSVYQNVTREGGIDVIRVRTLPHKKIAYCVRAFSEITLPLFFWRAIRCYVKGHIDIVYVYSPPLPLAITGHVVKLTTGARFILNVHDIFPQNALDLGILTKGFIYRMYEYLEKYAYKSADYLLTPSQGNADFLIRCKHVPRTSVKILPNWVNTETYRIKSNRVRRFRQIYGLNGAFIFLFAGVVGPSQGLDALVRLAERVSSIKDLIFLVIGDGTDLHRVMSLAKAANLSNIQFRPYVSKDEYPKLVSEIDVGIVCLSSRNTTPVIPAKINNFMAAGKPVLAMLHTQSDGHDLIRMSHCGFSCNVDDSVKAEELTRYFYDERKNLDRFASSGMDYAKKHLDRRECVDALAHLFA